MLCQPPLWRIENHIFLVNPPSSAADGFRPHPLQATMERPHVIDLQFDFGLLRHRSPLASCGLLSPSADFR
jgi:hypothetical protein